MKTTFLLALAISSAAYSQANFAGSISDNYTKGDTLTAAKLENIKTAVNDNDALITENKTAIDDIQLKPGLPDVPADGDLLYWNGLGWVSTPAPINCNGSGAHLKLTAGVPSWTCAPTIYAIGDTGPAGGKVFHVTDGGLHGLEAAPADLVSARWGCEGTTLAGTNATSVGSGAHNTSHSYDCLETGTAAKVAAAYQLNGYTDWFLPSRDELNLLYVQKNVVGGFVSISNYYMSSSQVDSVFYKGQFFTDGGITNTQKNFSAGVRAVRAF